MKYIFNLTTILALVIFSVNANPLVKKHPECEFGDLERKCKNVCVDVTELKTEFKEIEDCQKKEICETTSNCRLVDKCSIEKVPYKVKITKPKCELDCKPGYKKSNNEILYYTQKRNILTVIQNFFKIENNLSVDVQKMVFGNHNPCCLRVL